MVVHRSAKVQVNYNANKSDWFAERNRTKIMRIDDCFIGGVISCCRKNKLFEKCIG